MHLSSEKRVEVAKRLIAGERAAALAVEFGISHPTVHSIVDKWVKATGHPFRRRPRKYLSLREDAFSEVTPESAYWIGFLMADGNVFGNNSVKLSLAIVDRPHVEKFRDFLGSGHKVADRPNDGTYGKGGEMVSVLQVKSKSLVSDLACFGVVPCKSHTAKVEGLDYDPDFWRGMIDGDGSIGFTDDGVSPYIVLYGDSPAILGQFRVFVRSIAPDSNLNPGDHPTVGRIGTSGRPALAVIDRLYGTAPASASLDRKREAAEAILCSPWAAAAKGGRHGGKLGRAA